MENIQFSLEANLLPDIISSIRIQRLPRQVWKNLIVVGVKDDAFSKAFAEWNKLMTEIKVQKKST
jgi:hypothetical protein